MSKKKINKKKKEEQCHPEREKFNTQKPHYGSKIHEIHIFRKSTNFKKIHRPFDNTQHKTMRLFTPMGSF